MTVAPTRDPAYPIIRETFEIRIEGTLVDGTIPCTEPFSAQPAEQLSDALVAQQVLRVAYMSQGTTGRLPWTTKSLWDWMKTNVAGINFKAAQGTGYCCDAIDGKLFIAVSQRSLNDRDFIRNWDGISAVLAFYAHEIRHADPGSPLHVGGCRAFPVANTGCDATYDSTNLGAYGVQYWLQANWATGYLNVGIACLASPRVQSLANWHAGAANSLSWRFVTNEPSLVQVFAPFGGLCLSG